MTASCGIAGWCRSCCWGVTEVKRPDPWLDGWSREDLQLEQSRDPVIAFFIESVLKGNPLPSQTEMNGLEEGAWALYNRYDCLQVQAGLLYVRLPHAVSTSLVTLWLVTPATLSKAVLNYLHSSRPAGCSPNLMMLGREARLLVEVMVGCLPPVAPACPVEYVEWVWGAMTEAFNFARKFLKKSAERQKKAYDNGCPK